MSRPVRWLHISDLHLGSAGEELWWTVRRDFEQSVGEWVAELGAPDLILVSGDLSNKGRKQEFQLFDRFLLDLLGWIGKPAPLVIPVPGNHDVQRPDAEFRFAFLDGYGAKGNQELEREFWEKRDTSAIAPLFDEYTRWLKRRILPELRQRARWVNTHRFPGDLCVELEIDGTFPLCIVGLNSTWQQYKGGDFDGQLVMPAQQFQAVVQRKKSESPLAVFERCPRGILMMHHPPSWLSQRGGEIFHESIYHPLHFDLCLHGHLHRNRSQTISESGGSPRCYFQARSLNGLDAYREGEQNLRRQDFGYAWGSLSEAGEVRLWPLKWVRRGNGEGAFVHDQEFKEAPDGVVLRSPAGPEAPRRVRRTPTQVDWSPYLEAVEDATRYIKLSGIFTRGSVRGVVHQPIEQLYTPLRSRSDLTDLADLDELETLGDVEDLAQARYGGIETRQLSELLPRHQKLLIEGQPGAGKTTFLQLVACMLARDRLGKIGPEGRSWSARYLGFEEPSGGKPPVPVLIRLAELVPMLRKKAPGRRDDRGWLLDFLAQASKANRDGIERSAWQRLLESGEAMLLLDGLDEVADGALRTRVFTIFRNAVERWPGRIVVASRPIDTAEMRAMGFHTAAIEPFGRDEIRTFLDRWVAAVHEAAAPSALGRSGEQHRAALESAIVDHAGVRRLAANPVMLTCLCVVHFNEGGRLPEGRSRVYRAVIDWLLAARSEQRRAAGFSDLFARYALARLAFAMMAHPNGKRALWDLHDAVKALEPELEREFPQLDGTGRRRKARDWLAFECMGSGIVEEVSGRQLRFWHLTFQEYLAALHLALWDGGSEDPPEDWWPVVEAHLADAQWRETLELFPGCLLDEGGRGRVDRLLRRVLSLRGSDSDLVTEARVAGIFGRLIEPMKVFQYTAPPEIHSAFEAARKAVMPIFEKAGAAQVPVADRIAAAEALGLGGDPRLRDLEANLLPVPPLPGLRLGRYPVTVEEYRKFVEDERGYEDERFWSEEGWQLRKKEGWSAPDEWEEQLRHPNRPVVNVSWHEANAYCRWMADAWGCTVRLPTGEEWLAAAFPDERTYPWGEEEPTEELANFSRNVGSLTPVGCYPAGEGEFGHRDLVGNTWEWGLDEVEVSAENRKRIWLDAEDAFYSLRGGSWTRSDQFLQPSLFVSPTAIRRDSVGFRVASCASI
jgi:3',5'-cyclic AMP phosphodiesterase CpdA